MAWVRRVVLVTGCCGMFAFTGGASSLVEFGSTSADDPDTPITYDARTRATTAALTLTRGGLVTDTEVGDQESYYEVEVTFADGTEVDVQVDQFFAIVGMSTDCPHPGRSLIQRSAATMLPLTGRPSNSSICAR